uniref:Secreted protein n=1 Tax=Romanomermis culicivorax TaxID=13658 RepID=A0A915IAN4_ROMCU
MKLMSSLTGRIVSSTAMVSMSGNLVAVAGGVCWAVACSSWSIIVAAAGVEAAMVTISVGGIAATGGATVGGVSATAGRRMQPACLTVWRMASTAGEDSSPSNKNFSMGEI